MADHSRSRRHDEGVARHNGVPSGIESAVMGTVAGGLVLGALQSQEPQPLAAENALSELSGLTIANLDTSADEPDTPARGGDTRSLPPAADPVGDSDRPSEAATNAPPASEASAGTDGVDLSAASIRATERDPDAPQEAAVASVPAGGRVNPPSPAPTSPSDAALDDGPARDAVEASGPAISSLVSDTKISGGPESTGLAEMGMSRGSESFGFDAPEVAARPEIGPDLTGAVGSRIEAVVASVGQDIAAQSQLDLTQLTEQSLLPSETTPFNLEASIVQSVFANQATSAITQPLDAFDGQIKSTIADASGLALSEPPTQTVNGLAQSIQSLALPTDEGSESDATTSGTSSLMGKSLSDIPSDLLGNEGSEADSGMLASVFYSDGEAESGLLSSQSTGGRDDAGLAIPDLSDTASSLVSAAALHLPFLGSSYTDAPGDALGPQSGGLNALNLA